MSDDSDNDFGFIANIISSLFSAASFKWAKFAAWGFGLLALIFIGYYVYPLIKDHFEDTSLSDVTMIWYNDNANFSNYYGQNKDGERDGLGWLQFKNGNSFVGEFSDDKQNGYGIYSNNKEKYTLIAEWKDGLNCEKALFVSFGSKEIDPKIKYFENGKVTKTLSPHIFKHEDGSTWYSEKNIDDKEKQLALVISDKIYYTGYIKKGKIHGFGRLVQSNTNYYGYFENNKRSGFTLKNTRPLMFQYYKKNKLIREKEIK